MSEKYSRQIGIINPKKLKTPITIVGVGSVGSWTALALAKIGCRNIKVIDFDTVEDVNTATQLYSEKDIGEPKVVALAGHISELTGVSIVVRFSRWEELEDEERISPIIIVAVDSMEARQMIWEDIRINPDVEFLIDGRMGGELIRLFTIPLESESAIEYYKAKLTPKEVEPIPCSERAVAFNGFTMAGFIAAAVAHWAKGDIKGMKPELIFDLATFQYN